jgi:Mannosylglycerate hydrolase MGH1-like glycoside hydrolase domain
VTRQAQGERTAGAERERLARAARGEAPWRRWGPYLSERQWGTVREDYSATGDAWAYFPHEHARSRAYRWGEDGLLGLCDEEGFLCFALALWNGKDRILKERLFGVSNPEGNHGEDVKELYYYLDATPTASYLKALYKYPQAAFPYEELIAESGRRTRHDPEYELLDTGAFDGDRYFDVFVEYAKAAPEDVLVRVRAYNRGPDAATLHLVPTLWFRNTWSWKGGHEARLAKPRLTLAADGAVVAEHATLGRYLFTAGDGPGGARPEWLFTENETNAEALFGSPNASPFVKDAFHAHVVGGRHGAVHPGSGTKCAAHWTLAVAARGAVELRLRLRASASPASDGDDFDGTFAARIREADELYAGAARPGDAATLRQAAAGLVWSKQFYYYAVKDWLEGDPVLPAPPERRRGRNADWHHVFCRDVISMPDKWEFPWFAAWDLAFQAMAFTVLDPDFAREQLRLMLRAWYMHPSGQLPAYEYEFGDVNPPVHAWACRHLSGLAVRSGAAETEFLRQVFVKLAMNFTWWVNRKDPDGRGLFSGGFLGLDNIGVFDRSKPLPPGVALEQADGTAWMALFCVQMLAIAIELARADPGYEDAVSTFLQHFSAISTAMNRGGDAGGLWDEEDGFYYDHLRTPAGTVPVRVRSLVGLLPVVGVSVVDRDPAHPIAALDHRVRELLRREPHLGKRVRVRRTRTADGTRVERFLLALVPGDRLERVLGRMLDAAEFLSPHGIRSLSRAHADRPYSLELGGRRFDVMYTPGESDGSMFGGNSNWRGPVWFPLNALLVQALHTYHRFYGDDVRLEFPKGSGKRATLREIALALEDRLLALFRPGPDGRRPCHGDARRYAEDPHFRELILFYEYFHGDSGRGCGASHQTGWTGLAASLAYHLAHARGA